MRVRLFHESFDKLTPSQLASTLKWASVGSGVVSVAGRHGNGVTGTSGATTAQNTIRSRSFFPGTPAHGSQGFAVKCPTALPASEWMVWALLDDTGVTQLSLTILTDGKIRLYRGAFGGGGVALATSAVVQLSTSEYIYLQIGYQLTGADAASIRCTTAAGVTTSALLVPSIGLSSPRTWMQSEFYLTDHIIIDDYYVNNGAGTPFTPVFSGDTEIKAIVPIAMVFHTYYFPWTPVGGSDTVDPIDDATQDGDGTYLYTRDSYSTIRYQMAAITDDGRTVDDAQMVGIVRAVSSSWLPGLTLNWQRWDGTVIPEGFADWAGLTTDYHAILGLTQGGTDELKLTIARVNASRYGVAS